MWKKTNQRFELQAKHGKRGRNSIQTFSQATLVNLLRSEAERIQLHVPLQRINKCANKITSRTIFPWNHVKIRNGYIAINMGIVLVLLFVRMIIAMAIYVQSHYDNRNSVDWMWSIKLTRLCAAFRFSAMFQFCYG